MIQGVGSEGSGMWIIAATPFSTRSSKQRSPASTSFKPVKATSWMSPPRCGTGAGNWVTSSGYEKLVTVPPSPFAFAKT